MKLEESGVSVKEVELILNRKIILTMLVVMAFSIVLSGYLSYIFSDSIYTVLCSLIIGATIGVLINYFILVSNKIVEKINIELYDEDDMEEELQTVMKIS
jgi:membrane protein DedA with SNARE-associated domain